MEKRPKFLDKPLLDGEFIFLDKEVNPTMDIRLWFLLNELTAWIHTATPEANKQIRSYLANLIQTIDQTTQGG